MRSFDHPNFNKEDKVDCCILCGTQDDKPVTLIGVVGTEDGNNIMAKQFHVDCIELLWYPNFQIIGMKVPTEFK